MTSPEQPLPDVFRLGDWRIDGNALTASRGGETRPLEPKAHQVLRYLCECPGELVSIDELMDAAWAGTVVTPNAVSRVIAQLRKALDDDAKNPRYIETVARTGYRCIATPAAVEPERSHGRTRYAVAALALVAVLGAVFFLWPGPGEPVEPSVAVLPFENLTGDADADYIGDGLAEEIINSLTRIPGLRVKAQQQSFRFRGSDHDPGDVAAELDVSYVVAGSVRRSGPNLRLTARLVDPASGDNLRSITEEYGVLELFEGQDAVSQALAGEVLAAAGLPAPDDVRPAAPDSTAYDHYLRGRHIWHRRGTEDLQPAIDNFLEAVKIDPDFARGWAALSMAYLNYPTYSPRGYATWYLAEGTAQKALQLDPDIAEAYAVLATFAYTRFEWEHSEALYRQGLELNPQSATVNFWYGQFLEIVGKRIESVGHIRRTLEIDPTYQAPQLTMAFAYLGFNDYAGAAERFGALWQRGFRTTLCWMGNFMSAHLLGDAEQARAWIDIGPVDDAQKALLRRFVAADLEGQADPELGRDLRDYFWSRPDYPLGVWLGARLRAHSGMFALMNNRLDNGRLLETRHFWAPGTTIRYQPEFLELMERIGLVDYWERSGWGAMCRPVEERIDCSAAGVTPAALEALLAEDTPP